MNIKELKITIEDFFSLEDEYETKTHFNDFEKNFPATVKHDFNYGNSSKLYPHVFAAEILAREMPSTQDHHPELLYLACSYGFGPKFFNSLGYDVIGIDLNIKAIAMARKNGLDCRLMNALALDFENDSFDGIISRDFLREDYHVETENIKLCIIEQYRVLKENGIAVSYSMVHDEKLHEKYMKELPFSILKRYKIVTNPNFDKLLFYVDVFVK